MEATAIYDYSASHADELSFHVNDIIKILNEGDGQWYNAELNGKLGIVPANYLTFEPPK
ncbi:hypothetical protein HELRODRAFT_66884 [Helobdella robusta]|uniref:SH3 domain-containing protein n=1 Tax=Helobdella robusta TaxID=6412 RepID=T1FYS4_HELRO|nr:hypothetical protein HELRODRAFT_66884 [Helobdella robusta]ESN99128.1 hypothetical protein HELRODRAFT_66884 [Helobdella robusta]